MRVIARNLAIVLASQLGSWAIAMVRTAAVPRLLGAEAVGQLHLATSIWLIGLVVMGFGTDLVVVKIVARDSSRIGGILATSLITRLVIFVPVSIALYSYALAVGYSDTVIFLLLIGAVGALGVGGTASVQAVLRGLERMGAMSVIGVFSRLLAVIGAIGLLLLGFGVLSVAGLLAAGGLLNFLLVARVLRRERQSVGNTGTLTTNPTDIKALLTESRPYLAISLSIVLYQQVDVVVISLVVDRDEVLGWYSVFDRLFGMLLFVPTAFMTVIYPAMSRMYGAEKRSAGDDATDAIDMTDPVVDPLMADGPMDAVVETQADTTEAIAVPGGTAPPSEHTRLIRKCFQLMLLISVPAGFGLAALSQPFVSLLFGSDFAEAAPVVAVGGIVVSLTYLTTIMGVFLISMDLQKTWARVIAFAAVLTIPLDILLVPLFEDRFGNGAIGGASAYLVTETVILAGAFYLLPRGSLDRTSAFFAMKTIVAGLIMVAVIMPVREQPLLVGVVVGAIVYGVLVFAFRLVTPEDRRLAASLVPARLKR